MTILEQFGLDPNKYFLGVLCKREHSFEGTGNSLRTKDNNSCRDCKRFRASQREKKPYRRKEYETDPLLVRILGEKVASRYYLGKLCRNNHDFEGTGKSLKVRNRGMCRECDRAVVEERLNQPLDPLLVEVLGEEEAKRFFLGKLCKEHPKEHEFRGTGKSIRMRDRLLCYCCRSKMFAKGKYPVGRKSAAEYGYSDRFHLGAICDFGHEFRGTGMGLRYPRGRCVECSKEWGKEWVRNNPEKQKERVRIYKARKTIEQPGWQMREYFTRKEKNPEGVKQNGLRCNARRQDRLKRVHKAKYTPQSLRSRWQDFNCTCAYCCKPLAFEEACFDHFLPISKGGADAIGNLIPACGSCNSSKYNKDPLLWFQSRKYFTKKRWRFILKILGKTEANYNQLPLM